MRNPRREVIVELLIFGLLLPLPLAAYIDPGTGALVLQAIFALVLGGFFFARRQFQRCAAWVVRRLKGGDPSANSGEGAPETPSDEP